MARGGVALPAALASVFVAALVLAGLAWVVLPVALAVALVAVEVRRRTELAAAAEVHRVDVERIRALVAVVERVQLSPARVRVDVVDLAGPDAPVKVPVAALQGWSS